jgi:uncharacterized iron-regulated membrane protein
MLAAVTGILVTCTELFGEEEALREATRDLVSPVTARAPADAWSSAIARAFATVAARAGDVPVDKVTVEFKGSRPRVTVFTGKRTGGEDRKFVVDLRSSALICVEAYEDKPFLYRLHSGEAFGDGGLVMAMLWDSTLVLLTISGLVIYFPMRPRAPSGVEGVFW